MAGALNKDVMATENHRFLALRKPRALRASRELLLPIGPFFESWGRTVARALDEKDRAGPRTIDLDLLFYGDRIIDEPGLTVPHPRLHQRRFVLMPLNELDPLLVHPAMGRTVSRLLADVTDSSEVRLLFPQPSTRYGSRPSCSPSPGS